VLNHPEFKKKAMQVIENLIASNGHVSHDIFCHQKSLTSSQHCIYIIFMKEAINIAQYSGSMELNG
jgi:HD superfamily phosphohydrolase